MGIFYKLKMSFNNDVLNTDIRHFHIGGDPPTPHGPHGLSHIAISHP